MKSTLTCIWVASLYLKLESYMRFTVHYPHLSLISPLLFSLDPDTYHGAVGPIVRITPDEVHVNDPELIDLVYPGGSKKVNKDPYLMRQFG
jgi:hypothetical protein